MRLIEYRLNLALALACLGLCVSSGCMSVNRRLTIRSDPPKALVKIDGKRIGFTPVSVDFTHYGTREITLIKDGYETLTTLQTVHPPWYQVPPLDFVSDNFLPFRVQNRHEFDYRLQPKSIPSLDDTMNKAERLRSQALLGR